MTAARGGPRPRTVVGLVAKAPEPGAVKTRLTPPLPPEHAAAAAAAMLTDTLAGVRASGLDAWVVYTGDAAVLRRAVGGHVPFLAQRGRGLGERLAAAQADLFDHGFERVVLVGGDCPTVGPTQLREAVDALASVDVCLVPAVDGGYTLLASGRRCPELFAGVAMGTDRTGAETLARAETAGLSTRVLSPRYDLDTPEALVAALHAGQLDEAPATKAIAEHLDRRSTET